MVAERLGTNMELDSQFLVGQTWIGEEELN